MAQSASRRDLALFVSGARVCVRLDPRARCCHIEVRVWWCCDECAPCSCAFTPPPLSCCSDFEVSGLLPYALHTLPQGDMVLLVTSPSGLVTRCVRVRLKSAIEVSPYAPPPSCPHQHPRACRLPPVARRARTLALRWQQALPICATLVPRPRAPRLYGVLIISDSSAPRRHAGCCRPPLLAPSRRGCGCRPVAVGETSPPRSLISAAASSC